MSDKLQYRLSKLVSLKSKFSRNEAEKIIRDGAVFVNGSKITYPSAIVYEDDKIDIKGFEVKKIPTAVEIIAFNKPRGFVVTRKDEKQRPTIYSILPKQFSDFTYVGRLDMNTEGLILLTNNAKIAHELEDPQNGFEREYEVRVFGLINDDKIDRMQKGVSIDGMHYKAKSVTIKKKKSDSSKNTWLSVILETGKNREVRKLLDFFNLRVNRLVRVRYGDVLLSGLPLGAYISFHRTKLTKFIQSIEEKCGKKITF
jgi:23S rRNA pseudouridine2605 synthase